MSKKRNKRRSSQPRRQHHHPAPSRTLAEVKNPSRLLYAAAGLAIAGAALTAYLTLVRWFGESAAYCEVGSSCDLVQASRWSTLLGVPLSLWGFLMYLLLAGLIWRQRRRPSTWSKALTVAAFAAGMSLYLTLISVFEIQATCPYCLASFAIITSILVLLLIAKPKRLQGFDWGKWGIGTGAGLLVFLGVLHMHYTGVFDPAAGPEKPYLRALAEHLQASDARFFGASWCPACQDQKAHFEASADRLPYVECSPAGRGGPTAVDCVSKRVVHYPTWIINGRRHEGALSPAALAQISGFDPPDIP